MCRAKSPDETRYWYYACLLYTSHEAALVAVDDWPLLRWRMREYRHGRWGTRIVKANPQLAEDIVAAITQLGPSTAGQIEAHLEAEPRGAKGPWWGRSDTKCCLLYTSRCV